MFGFLLGNIGLFIFFHGTTLKLSFRSTGRSLARMRPDCWLQNGWMYHINIYLGLKRCPSLLKQALPSFHLSRIGTVMIFWNVSHFSDGFTCIWCSQPCWGCEGRVGIRRTNLTLQGDMQGHDNRLLKFSERESQWDCESSNRTQFPKWGIPLSPKHCPDFSSGIRITIHPSGFRFTSPQSGELRVLMVQECIRPGAAGKKRYFMCDHREPLSQYSGTECYFFSFTDQGHLEAMSLPHSPWILHVFHLGFVARIICPLKHLVCTSPWLMI